MLGFKSKKGEVLQHWIGFVDGFSFSPQEFYKALEKQLEARKIPGMDIDRVEFSEGGLLSDKRLYLRMARERLLFDSCAAPFGNIFFFSCRTVYIPPVIKLWHILVLLFVLNIILSWLTRLLGFQFALVAVAGLILAVAQVFQNTLALGLADLDSFLIKAPVIGPIYERWFRKETYYREDSRLLYLETVPRLVKELAEETAAAKGVKLVRQYQNAPILGDLYKPLPSEKKSDTP